MSIGIPVTKTKLSDIHIDQLMEHINDYEQQNQIKKALILYNKLFDTRKPVIASNVKPHEI
ncbi:unnamed protein product, partial [Rotaria socialis]